MLLYVIDPGNTTGFCVATATFNGTEFSYNILDSGVFKYPENMKPHLRLAHKADTIVIEDFIVRKSFIGERILTIRVIGAFEGLYPQKCVFQQPSEKARVPDALLKKEGLFVRSPHIKDAYRHLLIYLFRLRGQRDSLRTAKTIRQRILNDQTKKTTASK